MRSEFEKKTSLIFDNFWGEISSCKTLNKKNYIRTSGRKSQIKAFDCLSHRYIAELHLECLYMLLFCFDFSIFPMSDGHWLDPTCYIYTIRCTAVHSAGKTGANTPAQQQQQQDIYAPSCVSLYIQHPAIASSCIRFRRGYSISFLIPSSKERRRRRTTSCSFFS